MKSIMSKKKSTKIYFRVLPVEKMTWDYVKILDDNKTIYVRSLQQLTKSKEQAVPTFWTFHTDYVFFNHTQTAIYDTVIPDVFDSISQAQDAVIMSYGQTGTGKSLTANGLYYTFEERGILPRVASDLFHKIKKEASKNNIKMSFHVSYVEFSKMTVYDLLKSYPNNVSSFKDTITRKVTSFKETLEIIFTGEGRKLYSENSSYPSHTCSSVFTFYINAKNTEMQDDVVHKCKLHIIDLAGADVVGNFTCLFKNAQQIGAANLAKTQLEQFFLTLCSELPEVANTKQRLNPMLHYLGDSLKKTSTFRLIGHIRVSKEDLLVTISMLRFGEVISGLKVTTREMNTAKHGYTSPSRLDVLEKELEKLKLNNHSTQFMKQDLAKSLNEERLAHIERTVKEYLQNKISQVTLTNVCDVNIALEILKMIYKKCEEEKKVESSPDIKPTSVTNISRGSHKSKVSNKSRLSEMLAKKKTDERALSNVSSAEVWNKVSSSQEMSSAKPKRSTSSLLKRSSTSRQKSTSSVSLTRSLTRTKSKSKSFEETFMPEMPPEYNEAWSTYINERSEEYSRLLESYKKNEVAAKAAYRSYLFELEKLKQILSLVEKSKHDLLLAKMTRDFQHVDVNVDNSNVELTDFQKCCMEQLRKAEQEKLLHQELVLKCQAELKFHINVCNDMKKDLNNSFNAFCKEKYHVSVMNLLSEETLAVDVLESLEKEEEKVEQEFQKRVLENPEAILFENLKSLIKKEKMKRKMYLTKQRGWVTY